MNESRRRFLGSLGALGAAASAGCVGILNGGGDGPETTEEPYPNVVLGKRDPPDDLTMEQYRARRWPVWNERVPDVEVPVALAEKTIALREVSTPSVLTFFYSSCTSFCPRLVSSMANMQDHAIENGYAEEVTFLPITFDPERDTPEALREYKEQMNVEDAGNWYFLRPESKARAKAVVKENFVGFTRVETDGGGDDFAHRGVHLLVNADGYVERAYQIERGEVPRTQEMIDDLRKVRNA